MLKVLIVDDEAVVRRGIVLGVDWASMGCVVVGEASNGEEGIAAAEQYSPNLIITDVRMPKMDGIAMMQELRRRGSRAHVIMLTAYSDFDYARSALQFGADDYLLKPFDLRELAARLHTLLRRVAGRSVNLIEHGSLTYDPSSRVTLLGGQPVDLSRREQALLQALLHNRGRVLSSEQLKDSIYGFGDELESNALNVHIHHLRRKLGNGIVETVRGLGYRLGPADSAESEAR